MEEDKYNVALEYEIIATGLRLEYAVLMAKALFEKYYADPTIKVTITRERADLPKAEV